MIPLNDLQIDTWIASPLGDQYQLVWQHPMRDEWMLMDCDGNTRMMPTLTLITKWSKLVFIPKEVKHGKEK